MQDSKYLVATERDLQWGLTVSTVGYDDVPKGGDYPTQGHADGYYFDVKVGRVLPEYQMLYLMEGEGTLSTKHVKDFNIKAGDIFLLFPGEWHTYCPKEDSSWKSYWIGYKGRNMDDRVRHGFITPEKPVYHIGYSADIVYLYKHAMKVAKAEAASYQQVLAGIVNNMIGLMFSLERNIVFSKGSEYADIINRARQRIRENLDSGLTIQQVAEDLSVSYSNFRKLFKEFTGISPALYQQDLRLQRAKELLTTTDLTIKEIAYRLNFESPDYFFSKFRIKTGYKPSSFRYEMRGEK